MKGSEGHTMRLPNDRLAQHLKSLEKEDLKGLLTQGLRVSDDDVKRLRKPGLVLRCSKELRSAAGSSLRNSVRGDHDFPYKQILIDVADKLTEGATWLSWTKYKLEDSHTEAEIESTILRMFEERARKWWKKLSRDERAKFTTDLQTAIRGDGVTKVRLTDDLQSYVTQQAVENVIQSGIIFGLSKVSIPGLPATLGISVVSQVGWLVLLHTVGWMTGLKIAIFGLGGYGAWGGFVGSLGGTVIGGVLGLPSLLVWVDGPAYRKTVPTMIMLLTRTHQSAEHGTR
jgi:uncharacterized protein YaaW (UPF0174 family)